MGWIPSSVTNVILNWPERIKTQPHDDRDNCFLHFDSKGPCGMTVNNDIDDDSATKHGDSHTERSRQPASLGLESRILKPNFSFTYVTISRARILKSSQASGVENQVLLELLRYQRFQASPLDLVVHLTLQLLGSPYIGLRAFNSRLEFLERTTSRRNDWAKNIPLPSSAGRIISFLQSSPRLQWVLPRVGTCRLLLDS